jgi:hypothetical protein
LQGSNGGGFVHHDKNQPALNASGSRLVIFVCPWSRELCKAEPEEDGIEPEAAVHGPKKRNMGMSQEVKVESV